ncbi:MAG: ABC transporter permease [Anaerolineales bacterium]|nr:ABC transporter permease [Anaerolineales bacterium]
MRARAFASRNSKELLRDPLSMVFCVVFPLFLLVLVSLLNRVLPPMEIFSIENFTPGTAVFSFSFLTLFSGMLIGKDRSSSFLMRLFASPMSAADYLVGYSLPLLPIALGQSAIFFIVAFFLGLPVTTGVLMTLLALIPIAALFIGLGLLFGSVLTDRQVGGFFSVFAWLEVFLSGMWLDLNMVGGTLKAIGYALPFAHAVDAARAALVGDYAVILPHLLWVIGYAVVVFLLATWAFRKQMRS